MKVLIGVDDSEHAKTTLEFVRKVTWPKDTSMTVVSTVQLPIGGYPNPYAPAGVDVVIWLEELTKLHESLVSRGAKTLADAGIKAHTRVLQGDPRETLIEEAQKERADLIVVGSHGRSGIEKALLGGVASHVVAHASCSVLVVRREPRG